MCCSYTQLQLLYKVCFSYYSTINSSLSCLVGNNFPEGKPTCAIMPLNHTLHQTSVVIDWLVTKFTTLLLSYLIG